MPDWTYRPIFRPLLFRLPTRVGRDLALAAIGGVARVPGGCRLIEFMGHMSPPRPLRSSLGDTVLDSPVGLAPGIDPGLVGLAGISRLGFGFVGVGPVTPDPVAEVETVRDDRTESIRLVPFDANPGLAVTLDRLDRLPKPRPAVIVHLSARSPTESLLEVVRGMRGHAAAIALPLAPDDDEVAWRRRVGDVVAAAEGIPVLVVVAVDSPAATVSRCREAGEAGARGAIVGHAVRQEAAWMGRSSLESAEGWTRLLRNALGSEATVIAAAGIHTAGDAERLVAAGADLVAIDSGLVFSGPGLAKRCNECLLARRMEAGATVGGADREPEPVLREAWPWTLMLGGSLLVGGVMALVIACTRVVMPYDEAMSGLTRARIAGIGPRLLPFMTHDRVSLAGAMLGVGILFTGLAWWGVRRGHHWALLAVTVPSSLGFVSFFSFLGFGYFDPLHAFVSAILFQFMLLAMVGRPSPLRWDTLPDRHDDSDWLRAQWGQLGFVAHGATILVAGMVISVIGMTTVFIREDLAFLQLCAADLNAVPGLVPLIAHDRGTFGGMLMVAGLTMLLMSLWGFRRGAAWLWWTMLSAGTVGYTMAIAVHHAVGYVDPRHLAPAWAGLATIWLATLASRGYLCDRGRSASPEPKAARRPDRITT